jgi:hypothetical protein
MAGVRDAIATAKTARAATAVIEETGVAPAGLAAVAVAAPVAAGEDSRAFSTQRSAISFEQSRG